MVIWASRRGVETVLVGTRWLSVNTYTNWWLSVALIALHLSYGSFNFSHFKDDDDRVDPQDVLRVDSEIDAPL